VSPVPLPVPVANTGGPGTFGGHWREAIFGNELMTGYVDDHRDPLSTLTVAAFDDMGYTVNYSAAEAYQLPTHEELRELQKRPNAFAIKHSVTPGQVMELSSHAGSEEEKDDHPSKRGERH
jgi:hypothetical protein